MKPFLIIIVLVVVAVGGSFWLYTRTNTTTPVSPSAGPSEPTNEPTPVTVEPSGPPPPPVSQPTPAPTVVAPVVQPAPAPATPAPAAPVNISINDFKFTPARATVKKGAEVIWTNNDTAAHTITGDNGGPASSLLGRGETYRFTFTTTGLFPYRCSPHPFMKGVVEVTE